MKAETIKRLAVKHLGSRNLLGLMEWYKRCCSGDYKYVVFMVRRCYLTALIMERITGCMMTDSKEKLFITDSALISCCQDIADYYRKYHTFPKILLCDDVLIHGRNLNRLIENLEDCLYDLLKPEDRDMMKKELSMAVQILVYCQAVNRHLIINGRYTNKWSSVVKYEPGKWREFSSQLSSLITAVDTANASYIFSEFIGDDLLYSIKKDSAYKHVVFQNIEGYVKSRPIYDQQGDLYALYTLRVLKGRNGHHKVVPFVFLPNMNRENTDSLFGFIKEHGLQKGHSAVFFDKLGGDYLKAAGMRAYNEWISLILSQTVLQEFNSKYGIDSRYNQTLNDPYGKNYEIRKLARNYRFDESDRHYQYLHDVIENPIFETTEELDNIFRKCCQDNVITVLGEIDDSETVRQNLEDFFYMQGYQDELEAILYNGSPLLQRGVTKSMVHECSKVLDRIFKSRALRSIQVGIAYFVLMMDAGVLAISSVPASDSTVYGYAQFAKAGEQSLLIKPLRYYVYIPFLSLAAIWCKMKGKDYFSHIKEFAKSDYCQIAPSVIDELIDFVKQINVIEQEIGDWNGAYDEKVECIDQTSGEPMQNRYKFERQKLKYSEDYMNYTQSA